MADPRATRILVWMCVLIAVNQLGFGAIVPVIALYARSFGVPQSAIGVAIAVYGLARFLVAMPVGKLTDVLGRRAALALGGLVTAAGNLACAAAPNFATFVAARFVAGVGAALVLIAGQIVLADITTPARRGRVMAIYQGVFLFAVGVGPYPGGLLAERFGLAAPFVVYALAGGISAATVGPLLVGVLLLCGAIELALRTFAPRDRLGSFAVPLPLLLGVTTATGGLLALAWVALKVGALSYGGGFVIIPLMQADAVERYGWMTDAEFLNAVALGQVTPGPVVHTVAVVGYAAAGVPGAFLAALVAFAPSFAFVLVGARRFDRFVANPDVRRFFDGAGPAAIGAILGSAIPLALALQERWQLAVLAAAGASLFLLRRGVVLTLLAAGAAGAVAALLGAPVGP